ncbi:MAG: hypothetical protein KF744_05580 [Taibaiella sp.]|nr:hypothetical protein [Taibaiella sp.]
MVKLRHIFVVSAFALASCGGDGQAPKGPIVLGDSSMIVTESDKEQLKDLVTDLTPVIPPAEDKEQEPEKPAADTAKPAEAATAEAPKPAEQKAQPLPSGPGLRAEFSEVTVFIPGLSVKQHGRADLRRAGGATFSLSSGNLDGATLRVSGNVTKVSQRYQTIIVLKSSLGDIALDALVHTASWETIKGNNNTYAIDVPTSRDAEYDKASGSSIRLAVQREARQRRLSRQKTQHLLNEVRSVRSTNQKPLSVVVRSVMWKIDGKDERGRPYSKQVRLDIPY